MSRKARAPDLAHLFAMAQGDLHLGVPRIASLLHTHLSNLIPYLSDSIASDVAQYLLSFLVQIHIVETDIVLY